MGSLFLLWAACSGTSSTHTHTGTAVDCVALAADAQAEYDALLAEDDCAVDEDCWAPFGACVSQLGHCQEGVNVRVTQEALAAVEQAYLDAAEAGACALSQPGCDCYGGYFASCVSGQCSLTYGSTL